MIKLTPVDSSAIAKVGYENDNVTIEFNNGRTYRYYDVSEDVYEDLLNAPSVGKYFAENFGSYSYVEI